MTMLLRLSAGLAGWAVAFCVIYGLHGLGCARGWDTLPLGGASLQRWMLLGTWSVSLALTMLLAIRLGRARGTTLDRVAAALAWVGVVATLITFVPIAVVPACT